MKMNFSLLLLLPLLARCDDTPTLTIPVDAPVFTTVKPHFISYTSDWWTNSDGWGYGTSFLNMDFDNPKFQAAAKALSPAIWRIGGSRADKISYDMKEYGDDEVSTCSHNWCLARDRWLKAINFAQSVNARIVFTLNYIQHTYTDPHDKDTLDGQDWDSTEVRELLAVTKEVAPDGLVYGFELGNEVRHGGLNMDLERLGRAYKELASILAELWPDKETRPLLLGPATAGSGYKLYLKHIGEYLDIVTYHKYQHNGQDPELADLILDPAFLLKSEKYSHEVKPAYDFGIKEIWIGEGAMASHSGRADVTNTFLSTLWFANALGSMAKAQPMPVSAFCRQSLLGGHYELLDQDNLDPNPDFYMMRVWKHVVGLQTLDSIETTIEDQEYLRSHSFCGKNLGEVVVIFINISEEHKFVSIPMGTSRDVYRLQGEPTVQGRKVLLNGALQYMAEDGSLPNIVPVVESPEQAFSIPKLSVSFVVLHGTGIAACGASPAEAMNTAPSSTEHEKASPPVAAANAPAPSQASTSSSSSGYVVLWALLVISVNVLLAMVLQNRLQNRREGQGTGHMVVSQTEDDSENDFGKSTYRVGYRDDNEFA